jgi:CO/xanthine dehydrogenase FAD-binding subunit
MIPKRLFFAYELADLWSPLKSVPELKVMGGCTLEETLPAAPVIMRSGFIDELRTIDPHERFIEFGSAVTLTQILTASKRRLSPAFYEAIETIATPLVRNQATIGGNICAQGSRRTLFPVLLALDARLEFRSQTEMRFISLGKFNTVPEGMILTKIRIPVEDWDISLFRRLGPQRIFTGESAAFIFLAQIGKGVLSRLRIAYGRDTVYHSRVLENKLIGMRLPISQKTILTLLDETAERLANASNIEAPLHTTISSPEAARQFLDLLEFALSQLT